MNLPAVSEEPQLKIQSATSLQLFKTYKTPLKELSLLKRRHVSDILYMISLAPIRVEHIWRTLNTSQAQVSAILMQLRAVGWVTTKRKGREVTYSLNRRNKRLTGLIELAKQLYKTHFKGVPKEVLSLPKSQSVYSSLYGVKTSEENDLTPIALVISSATGQALSVTWISELAALLDGNREVYPIGVDYTYPRTLKTIKDLRAIDLTVSL